MLLQTRRHLIHEPIKLGVTQRSVLADQGRVLAPALGVLMDEIGQGAKRLLERVHATNENRDRRDGRPLRLQ